MAAEPTDDIGEFLAAQELFDVFDAGQRARLAAAVERRHYAFGDTVFEAGDAAEGVYLVRSGSVRVFSEQDGKELSQGVFKSGATLAELAALRDHVHETSARASAKTELWLLPRAAFEPLFAVNPTARALFARVAAISASGGFIGRLFRFKGKARGELDALINSVGLKRLRAGSPVFAQGEQNDKRLYVLRAGEVGLSRRDGDEEYPVATLRQGDVFGEAACLNGVEQPFSATALSDAVLLVVPPETVRKMLEHHPDLEAVLRDRIGYLERELERKKRLAARRSRPVSVDLESTPGLGERVIKRFALIEQAESADCGAACLAMLCRHYDIPMTVGKLREMANVTTDGATMDSLARTAETLGFTARGSKSTFDVMRSFELPFIAHWEGYHYIVVYGVSNSKVWVADPGLGFRELDRAEFERGWSGYCLTFTPGPALFQASAQRSPWLRFVSFLKPHKALLLQLLLATAVIEVLGIAPPVIVQNVLDRVIVHQNISLLTTLAVGLVIVHVFINLTTLLRTYLTAFMIRALDFNMTSAFFQHALSLPLSFFTSRKTGDIFARFQENATIRDFLTESTIATLLNLLMIGLYLVVLSLYSGLLTGLLLVMVIPLVLLTLFATPKMKRYARRDFETSTEAESLLMETLGAAETVKAMGAERAMRARWEKHYAQALNVQYDAARFHALIGLAGGLMQALISVVVLAVGAYLVIQQQLSIGQLIAFTMLMGGILSPLLGLIGLWDELQETLVAMERLGDVLDLEPEQPPAGQPSRIALPELRGDISLQGVYFRYGGRDSTSDYVLQDLSFKVRAGQTVAVVGHSGSGKSTLAKLLVGFYPPSEGKLLVDGYDITQLDYESYRRQIGFVMQSNLLFSGTVAENIALGEANPDRRRVVEVAQLADAHGFISALPLGYEQTVGERGMGLSGGQVQRICIARALYRDPRLLIFDEATSALDTQSEGNIISNLRPVLEGRSALVIAHRLSTVMHADNILVLYNGGIAEQGRHDELLARQGMYAQLVQKQLAGAGA